LSELEIDLLGTFELSLAGPSSYPTDEMVRNVTNTFEKVKSANESVDVLFLLVQGVLSNLCYVKGIPLLLFSHFFSKEVLKNINWSPKLVISHDLDESVKGLKEQTTNLQTGMLGEFGSDFLPPDKFYGTLSNMKEGEPKMFNESIVSFGIVFTAFGCAFLDSSLKVKKS